MPGGLQVSETQERLHIETRWKARNDSKKFFSGLHTPACTCTHTHINKFSKYKNSASYFLVVHATDTHSQVGKLGCSLIRAYDLICSLHLNSDFNVSPQQIPSSLCKGSRAGKPVHSGLKHSSTRKGVETAQTALCEEHTEKVILRLS